MPVIPACPMPSRLTAGYIHIYNMNIKYAGLFTTGQQYNNTATKNRQMQTLQCEYDYTNVNNNACVTNINAQIPSPQDGQRLPIAYN